MNINSRNINIIYLFLYFSLLVGFYFNEDFAFGYKADYSLHYHLIISSLKEDFFNKFISQNNKNEIFDFINSIEMTGIDSSTSHKEIEIPICYDEEFALDIHNVSKKINIDEDMIVKSHLSTNFFVYMIGFMPGLPFMGDLNSNLNVPRLITPRVHVPARSVGIVEKFCVIYPNESPGGWNIIGRTPTRLFFKNNKKPSLLHPGMYIKFRSISKKEFLELESII